MSEQEPSLFHKTVNEEKQKHIMHLSGIPDDTVIADYFKDRSINPDTIADFLKISGKNKDEIEGRFPKLRISSHKEDIIREIKELGNGKIQSQSDLIEVIGKHVQNKMSYDLMQVLFTKSSSDAGYAEFISKSLTDKNAKYAISNHQQNNLQSFFVNMTANATFSPNEEQIMRDISIHITDTKWLKEQIESNHRMRLLLQKLSTRYGALLYGSQYGGILSANQEKTRDVYEALNTIQVGVCRDFAMIIKQIYAEIAPVMFPESEVIYVENSTERHAYNLLVYEKDGVIKKEYYDPTSLILGGPFRVPRTGVYGSEKEVWANNGAIEGEENIA